MEIHSISGVLDAIGGTETPALVHGSRRYSGERFRRMSYKTGNLLRHRGVHEGSVVSVLDVDAPETVFTIMGAGLLGATVHVGTDPMEEAGVVVGPTSSLPSAELPPGATPIGFGTAPSDPSWVFFERQAWSENPSFPDTDSRADVPFLSNEVTLTQRTVVDTASSVSASFDRETVLAVRDSFSNPGTVVSGVVAPLQADATILLPDGETTGTVAVASDSCPEPERLDPDLARP
ncbi:MAG: hypothetical protein ABEJ58_02740 [Halodesulfurarchaeum sp.]